MQVIDLTAKARPRAPTALRDSSASFRTKHVTDSHDIVTLHNITNKEESDYGELDLEEDERTTLLSSSPICARGDSSDKALPIGISGRCIVIEDDVLPHMPSKPKTKTQCNSTSVRPTITTTTEKPKQASSTTHSVRPTSPENLSAVSKQNGYSHKFTLTATQGNSQVSMLESYIITYTDRLDALNQWTTQLPKESVLGFDTEGDGAVLQLCCLQNSSIIIFQLPTSSSAEYLCGCSTALSKILGSSKYLKVGIAAFDDALKLALKFNIRVSGIFDLTYLAGDLTVNAQGKTTRSFNQERARGVIVIADGASPRGKRLPGGLKKLYQDIFTSQFCDLVPTDHYVPPQYPARGAQKWITYPLRLEELAYAAKDALFGSLLYNSMSLKYEAKEIEVLKSQGAVELERRRRRRLEALTSAFPKRKRPSTACKESKRKYTNNH